jgi:hypothetical protein
MGNPRLEQWKNAASAALARRQVRRLAHPAVIPTFVIFLLFLAALRGCPKTPFEQVQSRAEAGNPHWLSIDLDTADKRHKYKESEFVAFTVSYSSAVGKLYKAEIAEGTSTVAATDVLHLSDGRDMWLNIFGIFCCSSKLIGLNDDPYVYRPKLRIHLKPGTYEMYVTTHRVFPWDVTAAVYEPSEWETASNLLKVRVVPDPGWQERALAKIQANPNDREACAILLTLDIPAATAKKLENIRNGVVCRPVPWVQQTFNETEYPTALKDMEKIVRSPDRGVERSDVDLILPMRIWMMHPELRNIPRDKPGILRWQEDEKQALVPGEKEFIRELCSLLPTKTPDARVVTQHTINGLTALEDFRDSRCQNASN